MQELTWFQRHPKRAREIRAKWEAANREKERLRRRKWKADNLDKVRRWAKEHPESAAKSEAKWRRENPIANSVYHRVKRAVKKGALVRPLECSRCSMIGRVYAHHADYSKPLDVVWLCRKCHREVHCGG